MDELWTNSLNRRYASVLDQYERRQQLADLPGQAGMPGCELLDARPLAGPVAGQERFGEGLERVAIRGRVGHVRDAVSARHPPATRHDMHRVAGLDERLEPPS